jgi:CubicO group peptidase (beta-lactamase class C family)
MLELAPPHAVAMSSVRLQQVKTTMQGLVDRGSYAGISALIARRGRVVAFENIGKLDLAANRLLQPDSLFRIYSLTKPVTCAAALMLLDEGAIRLEDPISKWIPEFRNFKVQPPGGAGELVALQEPITFWHLLTHTSGLGYGFFAGQLEMLYREAGIFSPILTLKMPLNEITQAVVKLPLGAQPGATWHYSLAHDVIGYLGLTEELLFCFPHRIVRPDRIVPARQDAAWSQVDLGFLRFGDL